MKEQILPQYIERHGRRYRVDKKVRGTRIRKTFETLEQAVSFLQDLERRVAEERRLSEERAPARAVTSSAAGYGIPSGAGSSSAEARRSAGTSSPRAIGSDG